MFQSLRDKGQYRGDEASARKAFLKSNVAWRSRVRGVSVKKLDHLLKSVGGSKAGKVVPATQDEAGILATSEANADADADAQSTESSIASTTTSTGLQGDIVGQRIYLPNIQIRLVRNFTPPGEAYDPTVATFRIPRGMTKTDLRGYLSAVYNLPVTFIRTDNYIGEVKRRQMKESPNRQQGAEHNYKRAIVGLEEPFHYPDDVEELYAQGQAAGVGDKWGAEAEAARDNEFLSSNMENYKTKAMFKWYKGYRWRSKTHDNEVSGAIVDCYIRRGSDVVQ
jgi:large subunit ribosomal protein L23